MVEQNATGAKNPVGLTVIDGHPVRIELGHAVRAARIKISVFGLRDLLNLTEHFRGRSLIEANLRVNDTDRFQQVYCTDTGDFRGGDWLVERYAYEALSRKVVDLSRLGFL